MVTTVSTACSTGSFGTRWETYQQEKTEWKTGCTQRPPTRQDCAPLASMHLFHERWDAVIGHVPASDALWAELEQLAAQLERDIRAQRDAGAPPPDLQPWNDRRQAIEEGYAQDIARQLADLERDAEMRRERAVAALAALGLVAQAVAAAAPAPASRLYVYPVPAPSSGKVDLPAPETCTYRLNALRGAMLCVDSRGTVRGSCPYWCGKEKWRILPEG